VSTINETDDEVLIFPMSYGQEQLWYLHEIEPSSSAYNIPFAFRIRGPLHIRKLGGAIGRVVRRQEALRTNFGTVDGEPRQIVSLSPNFDLQVVDLAHLGREPAEAEAWRAAREEAMRPFDLRVEWPIRARLLQLDQEDYVLLLSFHHIALDHLSVLLVSREIEQAYAAGSDDSSSAEQSYEPPLQFSDFVLWQREQVSEDRLAEKLRGWARELEGFSGVLKLPTDRARPPLQTFSGSELAFDIPATLSRQAKELSRQLGVSLFITLLTVGKVLLYRYSRQTDIVVGCPFANRMQEELEEVVGLFMNPLPVRTRIREADTFRTLVAAVRDSVFSAQTSQDIPFEKIVQAAGQSRDPSYNPLVQVLFTVQGPPMTLTLRGLSVESLGIHNGGAKLDLSFWLWEEGERIHGLLEYNTDLFERSTAKRITEHFANLLQAVVEAPEVPLWKLCVLSEAERVGMLEGFNETGRGYEVGVCLHELIERRVDGSREEVAVVYEGEELSYGELDARANRLARYLRERGVGRDVLVGVCAERSLELVIALLGVLKAGGAYVPLDPEYPQERLSFMLRDSEAKVLLTQARLLERLPGGEAQVLCLDRDWGEVERYSAQRLERVGGVEDLAYVIYTSGSTGQPKGAMNEHRGIVNRLQWMQEEYELRSGDVVLQKTPSSFDVSVWEFFWPLLAGARLVMAKPGGHQDPKYLVEVIERAGITVLHFVPSMLQAFLKEPGLRERCGGLRLVMSSGEALSHELEQRFFEALDAQLHNLYGPTEAAVDVTHWACERGGGERVVPIGRPIGNTRIYVLDEHMQPVPLGVGGELHIGGVQVGRGYWRRAQLTAERFVADPFDAHAGGRLYKTGDLARYRADGTLEYLGRLDDQVKVRGFRIELGEIEAALESHRSVRQAAAKVVQFGAADQRLVAYVVPRDEGCSAADLRKHLRGSLPDYMIPQHFVVLEELPLTPSGKLDRQGLPSAPQDAAVSPEELRPPSTATERLIADIWKEVIGGVEVSRTDNFFDLGGHSLLAIRAIVRIEEQTGWRPSVRLLILEHLQEIASQCDQAARQPVTAERGLLAKLRGLVGAD
jgi:amino acid adenylation domain-containing protein